MESDRKPKNLILVWGTGTDLERPKKYTRQTKTESVISVAGKSIGFRITESPRASIAHQHGRRRSRDSAKMP